MKVLILIVLFLFSLLANAQWIQLNETFGGNSVGTIKVKGNEIFVGTFDFGSKSKVFKSSDNGLTWNVSNSGLGSSSVHTFATIDTLIFAATYSSGIFKSTDNGSNWTSILNNIPSADYYSLSTKDSVIIVGTGSGELYQSDDFGYNWIKVDSASVCNRINTLSSNATNIFAGSCNGILTSIDNGINWTSVDSGLVNKSINIFEIKTPYVFATDDFRVYRTSKNGTFWEIVTNNLSINAFKRSFGVSGVNLLIGTKDGVFVTSDNGQNWISANSGLGNNNVNEFDSLSPYVYAATNVGVFRIDSSQITAVGAGTGITELSEYDILNVYPNPSNGKMKIEMGLNCINSNYELQILNVFGQTVYLDKLNNQKHIDVSYLPQGTYFLIVNNINNSMCKKIVIY